jgi:N-acetylneuraminate synthase
MPADFFHSLASGETPPYIIAEVGSNHNGDMVLARELIDAAKACGCDAVKFQSWSPSSLISAAEFDRNQKYDDSPKKHFGSLREMTEKYYLREDQHAELFEYCRTIGIEFCSSHFSVHEADLLVALGVRFFKLASMDVTNIPLLRATARLGKPMVISTGMANMAEIDAAVRTIEAEGQRDIVLLHCISIYPPKLEDIHLRNIPMLSQAFGYPVGFSDHSIGDAIPIASIALGSRMIEKHFTLDTTMAGWDHEISADPVAMKRLVDGCRGVFQAMGSTRRVVSAAEESKKAKFRRSLVTTHAMNAGAVLAPADLDAKRPGDGIGPEEMDYVLGRRLRRNLANDEQVRWDDLE